MRKGWSTVVLGEVLTPRQETCVLHPEATYKEITVSLWGKGVRLRGQVLGSGISGTQRNVAHAGDFIISKIDARHGACGLVPMSLDGGVVTNDFPLFAIDAKILSPRWLYWTSKSRFFVEKCQSASEGTTNRVRLKEGKFKAIEIPLPPISEQRRIVAHLDAIEARLARVQKLREEQEQQLLAALRSTFHRIESESEWIALGEVAPLVRREVEIDPTASYTEYGIKSFFKGIFLRRKMKGEEYSWQQLFWLKKGDVVFSNIMAWEKAIGFASPEADGWVGNHRMLVCEPRQEQVVSEWLYFYFTTAKGFAEILKASPGTAARNKTLKASNLLTIPVPIPSLDKQYEFKRLMDLRLAIQRKAQSTNERISALLPSLLDRVFNG